MLNMSTKQNFGKSQVPVRSKISSPNKCIWTYNISTVCTCKLKFLQTKYDSFPPHQWTKQFSTLSWLQLYMYVIFGLLGKINTKSGYTCPSILGVFHMNLVAVAVRALRHLTSPWCENSLWMSHPEKRKARKTLKVNYPNLLKVSLKSITF